jgi:hypothetical protein
VNEVSSTNEKQQRSKSPGALPKNWMTQPLEKLKMQRLCVALVRY